MRKAGFPSQILQMEIDQAGVSGSTETVWA